MSRHAKKPTARAIPRRRSLDAAWRDLRAAMNLTPLELESYATRNGRRVK